jgi:hypothetical protein
MRHRHIPFFGLSFQRRGLAMLGLALTLAATAHPAYHGADRQRITSRLAKVLEDPGHPSWHADGRLAVWVFFIDRAMTPSQRERALADAEAVLPDDVARRRSKVAAPGQRLVDEHDLPLDPNHLAEAATTGATLRRQSRWLGAASYDATPLQVRALASLSCVRRVDLVWTSPPTHPVPAGVGRPASQAPRSASSWTLDYGASLPGLELINVPPVHELGFTGSGVTLAMLDTGFRMTHEALDHIPVLAEYDFADEDSVVDHEPGDPLDSHAHGTQVISTLAGFAPGNIVGPAYNVSAILVRADNTDSSSTIEEDWWVAGLEWAEAQGADLVSSSLGFWSYYEFSDLDGDTAPSTVAADMAAARGLLVINGAGNQGGTGFDVIVAPADGDTVVAVGATDVMGVIALGSSSGPTFDGRTKPDVVALGLQVPVVDPYDDFAYTISGGTSFSGPFVAGVGALILERAPFLTPVQVREALRATADRHDDPDNHYGWGMVDALAAVYYWGPHIEHEELPDTEDTMGPYTVMATVIDQFVLDAQTPWLHYQVDGGPWQDVLMAVQGGDDFAADIPGQPIGSTIDYYLEASDVQGLEIRLPMNAPDSLFSFVVWQDTIPPVVAHSPLGNQPLDSWPPAVVASVTDNLGVAAVDLSFAVNDGALGGPYPLAHTGDVYARRFPLDAGDLTPGDSITYTITATDASAGANTTQVGPYVFEVIAGAGQILLMDDNAGGEAPTVAAWLSNAGYTVTTKAANATGAGDLLGKQAVVFLAGSNGSPLASGAARQIVKDWVAGGGRLLIEGGEVGFAALVFPGYSIFASDVLHVSSWLADSAGPLVAAAGQAAHDLLSRPLVVAPPIGLTYSTEGDQDAVSPMADALLVLENADRAGTAGALVYDDNPIDPAAQVIYYPFALAALTDQNQARALVVNAVTHLLDTGMPTGIEDDSGTTTPPRLARLLGVAPNPFSIRTVVHIEMAQAGPARLDVYDVRGRLVRRLIDGRRTLTAGPHGFAWDGRNEQGRDVSSGIYFVRLSAGQVVETGKLALIR